jgi:SAM-dependent methyltransferase
MSRVEERNTAIHDRVVECLADEPRGRLLDVGGGDGTLAARLAGEGFDVRACDRFLGDFRFPEIPVDEADLNNPLAYADGEFDVVVCTEVIEHLENPWALLRELHRITRPGGVVVISTPNLDNVYVRGWFLLSGKIYNFMESSYRDIGHITPVFGWNLDRMVENRFAVERRTYNANWLPKTSMTLPGRSRLLGQCLVVKLRRLAGPADAQGRRWDHSRIVRDRTA